MSKKVKFASVEEEAEFFEEFDAEIGGEIIGEENDLDLDTIRARSKSRTVKNIDEADEDEDDDEVIGEEATNVQWDSNSDDESLESIESIESMEADQIPEEEDDATSEEKKIPPPSPPCPAPPPRAPAGCTVAPPRPC